MKHSRIMLILTVAVLLLTMATVADACPSCAQALSNDPEGANPAEGFFWSILGMMSMPFLLAGAFGGTVYYHIRKTAQRQPDGSTSPENM